jgi:hypothetical protein
MKIRCSFLAPSGDVQTFVGQENGIWYTWTKYGPDDNGVKHTHNSREDALEIHDVKISLIKGMGDNDDRK